MTDIAISSFDALAIAHGLSRTTRGVTEPEVHVFSYLACLLSIYDGKDKSWWSYDFAATQDGAPYSMELGRSCTVLVANGSFQLDNDLLLITERGVSEIEVLKNLSWFAPRPQYLTAACESSLSIPLPAIREILTREPQLHSAVSLMQARPLLDDAGLSLLRPHFDGLRQALARADGDFSQDHDLLVPVLIWLTYLASESR